MHEHEMHEHEQQPVVNPIQVQKFLGGIDYPTDKQTLLKRAQEKGADKNVLSTLQRLPDQRYNSPKDISEQIGKLI